MIAGIRMGDDEIGFEQALYNPGIYQEVLGSKQLLVDGNGDWACWLGPMGWKPHTETEDSLTELKWTKCSPNSEWLFRPDAEFGDLPGPRRDARPVGE